MTHDQFMYVVRINTLIASLLMTYGIYDQAVKVLRTRSAKDFTISIVIALLYNELSWLVYGLGLAEWPIITITILNVPAEIVILAAVFFPKFTYRILDRVLEFIAKWKNRQRQ